MIGRLGAMVLTLWLAASAPAYADQDSLNQDLRQEAVAGVISHIEKLVKDGADINSKALHGETALDYAIRFGHQGAALKLIELGADPNSVDESGVSAIYRAAEDCNSSKVLEALLVSGARVNHQDLYSRNALMAAAHADCIRNVAILLAHDPEHINLDARNNEFQTASDLARDGIVDQMLRIVRNFQRNGTHEDLSLLKSFAVAP